MQREPRPQVRIVSPASAAANNGNWHTAARWRRFLAPVATVEIAGVDDDEDGAADLLIALHARRSAAPIARWRERGGARPVVLVLTGTDLYRDLEVDAAARHSLEFASRIVVLQEAALARLDRASRARAEVIVQSAPALRALHREGDADLVAVGHLREEKDPQTLFAAARLLAAAPAATMQLVGRAPGPTIAPAARPAPKIVHIGAALDAHLGEAAQVTMAACPNYRWLGALPHGTARRFIARARALVHPSRIEGGANVIVEAIRSGVPVLASRIDGNVGLLGANYDGYFPVGDAAALAALARRLCAEQAFAAHLRAQCALRDAPCRPAAERAAVRALVSALLPAREAMR
jgi:glycosyltransferase involved in cell wall biosynthesis